MAEERSKAAPFETKSAALGTKNAPLTEGCGTRLT